MKTATGALFLAALPSCLRGRSSPDPTIPAAFQPIARQLSDSASPGLSVLQGASEFVTGHRERFPFRLVDPKGADFEAAEVLVHIGRPGQIEGPIAARFVKFGKGSDGHDHSHGQGFYEATVPVIADGVLDIAVQAGKGADKLFGFAIIEGLPGPNVPGVGSPAVPAPTPTRNNLLDASDLCTAEPECPMHTASLDQALAAKKPVVVVFGSPKLCSSGVCGPVVDEVAAASSHKAGATFVHVEPYKGATASELTAAATAWRLKSEPWTFIIDKEGKVAKRFEGAIVTSHVTDALDLLSR